MSCDDSTLNSLLSEAITIRNLLSEINDKLDKLDKLDNLSKLNGLGELNNLSYIKEIRDGVNNIKSKIK